MVSKKAKKTVASKVNDGLALFEDEESDDNWGESKTPVDPERANKLKNMFFSFLLDISWKLAVSFLTPFFIALALSNGDTAMILIGIAIGFVLSVITIIFEVKRINKMVNDV